ncbi:MAG: AhpC/TSA family protein [Cyclobacteriaceae bacterium]|nr:AhpC/TSA family protein [Cyclobacteriaceae bacterium]
MKVRITLLLLFPLFIRVVQVNAQQVPAVATDISPLLIGEKIPDQTLKSISDAAVSLSTLFKDKPSVLIFYRGGWCPFCNTQLADLQTIEKDILNLGYQIVAISPDSPESLRASIDKHKLNYRLYSDASMALAQSLGIAFAVSGGMTERLKTSSGGLNPGMLPVPSVFVVNTEGEILFEYINPDYKKRIKGSLLLAVLKELK